MALDASCPSRELLRRSLDPDDPMTDGDRRLIEAHVDACAQGCKQAIDALLRDQTLSAADATPSDQTSAIVKTEQPLPARIGHYQIIDLLGRGGMGVVYKALQIKAKRIVALKMVLSGGHASRAELERFRIEGESVARLQHPNIVRLRILIPS